MSGFNKPGFYINGAARELCRRNKILNSVAQYIYLYYYRPPSYWTNDFGQPPGVILPYSERAKIRVAFLCDEMTWADFSCYCESIFLLPGSWREQLETFSPDLFFCEAAWSGLDVYDGCWRGRVCRNRNVYFENRKELLAILDYCKKREIRAAFWNKEDPMLFQNGSYDFVDTALRFDVIFTTAAECIAKYQKLGAKKIYLLPFGVNTDLFYPADNLNNLNKKSGGREKDKNNKILFAGSWFADQPRRCRDLSDLLDYAIRQGFEPDIYDRHFDSPEPRFRFPAKYAPYIRPAVPFARMPELTRRYKLAININSVTDSDTMYSRRVLQTAACGLKIWSNFSPGVLKIPGCRVVYLDGVGKALEIQSDFDELKARYHTRKLLKSAFNVAFDRIID